MMRRLSCPGLLQPAAAFFPDLPETLHRRRARDSVLPEAAGHSVDLVRRSERRGRHAGEFPAQIVQLRFIEPIRVHGGHTEIVSCSPCVRPRGDTVFPWPSATAGDVSGCAGHGHSVTVHAETTMDAAALGLKWIREQKFVMEDLADPVTVELVTSTQHKVSLRKVMEWMAHAGGTSPKEIEMKARVREG